MTTEVAALLTLIPVLGTLQKATPDQLAAVGELFDISRELDVMNREITFRQAKHDTAAAALKELTDFVKIESEVKNAEQAELVAQLEAEVLQGLKGQEGAILKQCIADLDALAAK